MSSKQEEILQRAVALCSTMEQAVMVGQGLERARIASALRKGANGVIGKITAGEYEPVEWETVAVVLEAVADKLDPQGERK